MKKSFGKLVLSLIITTLLLAMSITSLAASTSWNFKDSSFKNLGTITTTKSIDGLELIATSSKPMAVKQNEQTLNGVNYTYALSLGGRGDMYARSVKVPVNGESVIKVTLKSSGSSDRTLTIADDNGNQISI